MAKSKKSSPKKKSRSSTKRSSDQKFLTQEEMQFDYLLVIYIGILFLTILFAILYARKDEGWWDAISPNAPSWGDSEWLIAFIFFLWYIPLFYIAYTLGKRVKDEQEKALGHLAFILSSLLGIAYFYSVSDGRENFQEAFYILLIAFLFSVVLTYLSWRKSHTYGMYLGLVSIGAGIYLVAWSWKVYDNSR